MKSLLVLCSAFAIASAGVGTLSPEEEQGVLNLFANACANGAERAEMGGFTIFCKRSKQNFQETINHQVNVPQQQGPGSQVVFVEPPPVRYQHNIQINSPARGQGQAKIYVLPQKATHQISTNYNQAETVTSKPQVFFLNGGSSNNNIPQPQPPQYGPPAQGPAPQEPPQPQQPPQYGPPAQSPPQEGGYRYSPPVISTVSNGYF